MFAIRVASPGGPEAMALGEAPDPEPGPHDVLVQVAAAGVNRADLLQRAGFYPPPPGASDIIGLEVAGTVVAVGAEVTDTIVGDQVCALLPGGGYAQYALAHQTCVLPIPAGVSLIEAAALPEVAATVWLNLGMIGDLKAGDRVLIHGGASGIGTHAIQVVAALGGQVAATASSAKLGTCRELGADVAVDYKSEDFAQILAERWPDGANLVLDHIGGGYLERDLRVVSQDGTIIVIATMGGSKAELDLAALHAKRARVVGSTLRNRAIEGPLGKAEIIRQVREQVWPLIAAGQVKPFVGQTFPLAEAARAHSALAAGEIHGKAVLIVDHEAG